MKNHFLKIKILFLFQTFIFIFFEFLNKIEGDITYVAYTHVDIDNSWARSLRFFKHTFVHSQSGDLHSLIILESIKKYKTWVHLKTSASQTFSVIIIIIINIPPERYRQKKNRSVQKNKQTIDINDIYLSAFDYVNIFLREKKNNACSFTI